MERTAESPRKLARIAGLFYLISIACRIVADALVRDRIVVSSDAAATAKNILAHESLFRWGFIADIAAFTTFLVVTAILYELLAPVNRSISLIAAIFSVFACIAQGISSAFHLAPLLILGGSSYLRAFTPDQLQAFALLSLKMRTLTYHSVGLVFLGFYCLLAGCLIFKSSFMPRAVGALMALAGLAYIPFLSPPLAKSLLPYILIPAGVGQISLALWLVAFGVNSTRWRERAVAETRAGTPAISDALQPDLI